jgi:hypothetical protein
MLQIELFFSEGVFDSESNCELTFGYSRMENLWTKKIPHFREGLF